MDSSLDKERTLACLRDKFPNLDEKIVEEFWDEGEWLLSEVKKLPLNKEDLLELKKITLPMVSAKQIKNLSPEAEEIIDEFIGRMSTQRELLDLMGVPKFYKYYKPKNYTRVSINTPNEVMLLLEKVEVVSYLPTIRNYPNIKAIRINSIESYIPSEYIGIMCRGMKEVELLLRKVSNIKIDPGCEKLKITCYTPGTFDISGLTGLKELVVTHPLEIILPPNLKNLQKLVMKNTNFSVNLFEIRNKSDIQLLQKLRSSNIQISFPDISTPRNLRELQLNNMKIDRNQITHFKNIEKVNLVGCRGLEDLSSLRGNTIHTLNLSLTDVTDVTHVNNVHTLLLGEVQNLRGISSLGKVHKLDLNLTKTKDVSNLGNVRELDLSYCEKLVGLSNLGKVQNLNISSCGINSLEEIKNFSCRDLNMSFNRFETLEGFDQVHSLKAQNCKIKNLGRFDNIHYLDLSYNTELKDISSLRYSKVHTLILDYTKVEDISFLRNVKVLSIKGTLVSDLSGLENVLDLDCSFCKNITHIPSLPKIKTLVCKSEKQKKSVTFEISSTEQSTIRRVDVMPELMKIDMAGQDKLKNIPRLPKLKEAILNETGITDVTNLTHVRSLNLANTNVQDVSTLQKVHTLNLRETGVKDVTALWNLHYLNISNTDVEDVSALGNVHTLICYSPEKYKPIGINGLVDNFKIVLFYKGLTNQELREIKAHEIHLPFMNYDRGIIYSTSVYDQRNYGDVKDWKKLYDK